MKLTWIKELDPIIALLVTAFIIKAAWDMPKRSGKDLLDERLSDEEEQVVKDVLNKHSDKFLSYHNLRTRKAGSERFVDFHLVVRHNTPTDEAHALAVMIKSEIRGALKDTNVMVHVEPCDKNMCFEVNGVNVCVMHEKPETIMEPRCCERGRSDKRTVKPS